MDVEINLKWGRAEMIYPIDCEMKISQTSRLMTLIRGHENSSIFFLNRTTIIVTKNKIGQIDWNGQPRLIWLRWKFRCAKKERSDSNSGLKIVSETNGWNSFIAAKMDVWTFHIHPKYGKYFFAHENWESNFSSPAVFFSTKFSVWLICVIFCFQMLHFQEHGSFWLWLWCCSLDLRVKAPL